jgi:hypothetical protein
MMLNPLASSLVAVVALALLTATSAAAPDTDPPTAALREAVVRADTPTKAAAAYRAYFLHLGRASLKDLSEDADTGIALQAAWETHTKPVKRKEQAVGRIDDVYDPAELRRFVAFLKVRTKAPVPKWWAATVTDVDLFAGKHHAFPGPGGAGQGDREQVRVDEREGDLVLSSGGRSFAFPKATFGRGFDDSFAAWLGEKQSVVASYPRRSGFGYTVGGFEANGRRPTWKADVWAAGREGLGGEGYHSVEMTAADGVVYLFGVESHGAYVEAFDAASGKVRFRFCTCYWFHHSEGWGLK